MVGRNDDEIVLIQFVEKTGQPGIELLECGGVPLHVVAMPVLLVEIHQVHENQPGLD